MRGLKCVGREVLQVPEYPAEAALVTYIKQVYLDSKLRLRLINSLKACCHFVANRDQRKPSK